ncbi:hypothetical protein TSUD_55270 [Trifolium subterraneum]|uniref:Uncharacterized protein n=1 Tax=Trifolium subterraneum TaxID=3900 RepID=A0A2Z6MBD0_TRISU|nr:hypothetical protein TSUD_55270 [Trifolium subterraneum]
MTALFPEPKENASYKIVIAGRVEDVGRSYAYDIRSNGSGERSINVDLTMVWYFSDDINSVPS